MQPYLQFNIELDFLVLQFIIVVLKIWPIIDILKPGLLGSFKEFCEYFCYVNDKGKAIVLENKRASLRNELQKHVMLRRKKSDVLKELKDKVRYKEVIASDTDFYLGRT